MYSICLETMCFDSQISKDSKISIWCTTLQRSLSKKIVIFSFKTKNIFQAFRKFSLHFQAFLKIYVFIFYCLIKYNCSNLNFLDSIVMLNILKFLYSIQVFLMLFWNKHFIIISVFFLINMFRTLKPITISECVLL